jgi:Acetyltransferase (GNAT) domain
MVSAFKLVSMQPNQSVPSYWALIFQQDTQASPFMSAQWTNAWISEYGFHSQLKLATWTVDDIPIAVCLIVERQGKWGRFNVRQVGIHTCLDSPEGSACVEFNDILCIPAYRDWVKNNLIQLSSELDADEVHFSGIPASGLLDQFEPAKMQQFVDIESRPAPFLEMSSAKDPEGILNLFSANTRAHIRRAIKFFQNEGDIVVSVAQNAAQAAHFFDGLIELHQSYWTAKNQPGAFSSSTLVSFHKRFIETSFADGRCQIFKITAGQTVVGFIYGLTGNNRFYFYQSGINYSHVANQANGKNIKPGLFSHFMVIQTLWNLKFVEYDFLAGPSQYKRSISNRERVLNWKVFRNESPKMRSLVALAKLKRKILPR